MAKYNDLCAYVQRDKPTIILLTETWLTSLIPDGMVSLTGYTLYRKERIASREGGVCIYIADHLFQHFELIALPL